MKQVSKNSFAKIGFITTNIIFSITEVAMKIYIPAGTYTTEELETILADAKGTDTIVPTQWDTSTCGCRKENGGSGICGCILGGTTIWL